MLNVSRRGVVDHGAGEVIVRGKRERVVAFNQDCFVVHLEVIHSM